MVQKWWLMTWCSRLKKLLIHRFWGEEMVVMMVVVAVVEIGGLPWRCTRKWRGRENFGWRLRDIEEECVLMKVSMLV